MENDVSDIADQLFFLNCWFEGHFDYTYGTNLFGGLLPYHSEYNLSVLTLEVIGAKAGEVASGGFRLPLPLIGYISFGWIGIVLITGISSFFAGVILHIKRTVLKDIDMHEFFLLNILLLPYTIGIIPGLFTGIGIDSAACMFIVIGVFFFQRYRIKI